MGDHNNGKSEWGFAAYVVMALAFLAYAVLSRVHATH
jgi:hypothetical protein